MEADWSVEIGGDAPRIETNWAGSVDLCGDATAVDRIAEARKHEALRRALLELNALGSPVSTSKCDVWTLTGSEIDPLEFEASPDEAGEGLACYIDVVAREREAFAWFAWHEAWVRRTALALRGDPVRRGRADLVLRAVAAGEAEGFGATLYVAGCGADSSAAEAAWGEALRAAVMATMREARASSSIG